MDTVTISLRKHPNHKGNKENTQPPTGAKSFVKTGPTSAVPFQIKANKREDVFNKDDSLRAKGKQLGRKPVSGETQRKLQRDTKDVKAQILKPTVAEAPKQTLKPAPGMYKGRIVQSKIGSIWKSSDSLSAAVIKPPASKLESEKVKDTAIKKRSKSVTEVSRQVAKRPVPMRSKSVSDQSHQVGRPPVGNCRPAGFCSARPPTRTLAATLPPATSRSTTVAATKARGGQNTKPKIPVTDKKASRPVISSAPSQYRVATETAEEKRAKLAEWLASKGKTLKRPAMTTKAPPKTKLTTKVKVDPKVPENVDLEPGSQCGVEPNPSVQHEIPAPSVETRREGGSAQSPIPGIMNTTLDLLDDSEIVVNLCDALEAMAIPSASSDDADAQCDQAEECRDEEQKDEQTETKEESEVKQEDVEESEDDSEDDSNDDVMETTPQTSASVIKYSVKTTPYLQSVKKTIEGKVNASASRRKSNIKDLKFLTPVRRSSRIHHKSSHLPSMLTDHDPCVSSLAELVKLDDDPNAYIYRKNPALLQELPDQNTC
ncbi:cytoskeleton-associated protein 2 isoform X2 [Poecilia reticulata]|uniref:cytoskeleton-associated protein 2 isoform X2 n=1 Tax=Poecilia reticulata TaxID=8081 RepID=UPI0004A3722D|nr:PREDICTED: cytoskeleton-associated protein 2-like isoform X2 [Poecilia reticulata]